MPLGLVSLVLIAATALAAPLLLRAMPSGPERRAAAGVLGAMLLAWSGLYLLFWSRAACWLLVAAACALAGWASMSPDSRLRRFRLLAAAGLAVPALLLGLAFEALPGRAGLVVYVAGAVPFLLVPALALPLAPTLRWDARPRALLAASVVVAAGALVPLTSFWPSFLLTFEPAHLPVLVAALGALAWLGRRGAGARARVRTEALAEEGVGAFAARPFAQPWARASLLAAGAGAASLLAAAVGAVAAPAPPGLPLLAGALGAASLAGCAALRHPRLRDRAAAPALLPPAAALAASCIAAAHASLGLHVRAAPGPASLAALAVASAAAAVAGAGLLVALARWRDAAARERAVADPRTTVAALADLEAALPEGTVLEAPPTGAAAATVADLAAFAARVRTQGRARGVLVVHAPRGEPLWALPDAAYEWLLDPDGGAGATRVHVAVVEGQEASLVPPLLPEEGWA